MPAHAYPDAPKNTPAEPHTTIFTRLGCLVVRRRRTVLAGTALFIVIAAVLGAGTFGRLKSAGFQDPGAESTKAENILKHTFGAGDPNVVALPKPSAGTVDSPAAVSAGRQLTGRLSALPRVTDVSSYWSLGSPSPLRSRDATLAIVVARITGTDTEMDDAYKLVKKSVGGDEGPISVRLPPPSGSVSQSTTASSSSTGSGKSSVAAWRLTKRSCGRSRLPGGRWRSQR